MCWDHQRPCQGTNRSQRSDLSPWPWDCFAGEVNWTRVKSFEVQGVTKTRQQITAMGSHRFRINVPSTQSGHVTGYDSLSKTILQGTLEGRRRRGRLRKCWVDNVKEWTSLPMPKLLPVASCRQHWKRISAESSFMSPWHPISQGTELNQPLRIQGYGSSLLEEWNSSE